MTTPSPEIQDHPEYPFRHEEARAIRAAAARYVDAPQAGTLEEMALSAFIALGRRFAFLERLIQGRVVCSLPLHAQATSGAGNESPEEQGERLAASERALLDWETGAADELASLLDAIGIKILSSLPRALDSTGEDPRVPAPLFGAFSFEEGVGPALLVGRQLDQPEASFILAHEFGHLVADFDPYRSRFCRWDPCTLRNLTDSPEERRADRFARSLLMPALQFRSALGEVEKALETSKGSAPDTDLVEQLAAIFEVPAPLVDTRIEDLRLGKPIHEGVSKGADAGEMRSACCASRASEPADAKDTESAGEPAQDGRVDISCLALPERYVNLSLAAFSATILKPDTLAAFLDTTRAQAMRIASWANLPGSEEGQRP